MQRQLHQLDNEHNERTTSHTASQPDTQKPFRMIRMRSSVVALKLTP